MPSRTRFSHASPFRNPQTGRGFAIDRGLLARMLQVEIGIAVSIIIAGILLVVLKANPSDSIVSDVHGWARSLAHPFHGVFSFHNAQVAIAVNWGIAAVAYLLMGALIGRLTRRHPPLAPARTL